MSKTYYCLLCGDTCYTKPSEEKIYLYCSNCGKREITQEELDKLERDFNAFVKETVDGLKEKTKEEINVSL